MTDPQLIHAFLAGHEPSFELLMRRRRDLVYSIALRLVGNTRNACMDLLKSKHRQIMRPMDFDEMDSVALPVADAAEQQSVEGLREGIMVMRNNLNRIEGRRMRSK